MPCRVTLGRRCRPGEIGSNRSRSTGSGPARRDAHAPKARRNAASWPSSVSSSVVCNGRALSAPPEAIDQGRPSPPDRRRRPLRLRLPTTIFLPSAVAVRCQHVGRRMPTTTVLE